MWPTLLEWLPVRTFVVHDTSMQPALSPGDRLLVCCWLRPRRRDLVVARDPQRHMLYLVKRVANVQPNGDIVLHADNPNVSRDSREFGAVPAHLLVGRVVFRYLPAERRSWLITRR